MRFLRSVTKRYLIWKSQEGKCAICGRKLGANFHIDHIIPVSKGGKTHPDNLQATCTQCNLRKGNKMNAPSSGMSCLKYFRPTKQRPKIVAAIEGIVVAYNNTEAKTYSVEFPPRYGKSTVVRGSALELLASGAPVSIYVAPWELLADQIKDMQDIAEMYHRYEIGRASFSTHRCTKLPTDRWYELADGTRPTLVSLTIGLALWNRTAFLDGIKDAHRRFACRVPVFVDEGHLVKIGKAWGNLAQDIIKAGGFLIVLTGTPVPNIPGFTPICEDDWKDISYRIPRSIVVEGEKKISLETYEGERREVELRADISVSWKEAWHEGALARANDIWIDTDTKKGKLSELKEEFLNGFALKEVIETDDVIEGMSITGVERLFIKRKHRSSSRMLVVTGFDLYQESGDSSSNRHAEKFKKSIKAAAGNRRLVVEIATGVTQDGEPDDEAMQKIKDFRAGKIDVLIVKMMGLVGLDVAELKVLIYAGMVREGPLLKQALSRPLTTWDGETADIIMPRDAKMVKAFDAIIASQGGKHKETRNSELVDAELIDAIEKPSLTATGFDIWGYGDEQGRKFKGNFEDLLVAIKDRFITKGLTDAEILTNWERGAYPVDDAVLHDLETKTAEDIGIKDLDEGLDKLIGEFGREAQKIVSRRIAYDKQRPETWVRKVKELQTKAKSLCGVRIEVTNIDDANLLRRLIEALKEAERWVFSR